WSRWGSQLDQLSQEKSSSINPGKKLSKCSCGPVHFENCSRRRKTRKALWACRDVAAESQQTGHEGVGCWRRARKTAFTESVIPGQRKTRRGSGAASLLP